MEAPLSVVPSLSRHTGATRAARRRRRRRQLWYGQGFDDAFHQFQFVAAPIAPPPGLDLFWSDSGQADVDTVLSYLLDVPGNTADALVNIAEPGNKADVFTFVNIAEPGNKADEFVNIGGHGNQADVCTYNIAEPGRKADAVVSIIAQPGNKADAFEPTVVEFVNVAEPVF